jgi:microcystin-dependent protein
MASSLVATGVQFPDNSIQTTAATSEFTSGTVMLFAQTAAPTGWTKNTSTGNNTALRLVTGTASTGGSVAFTTAFASQTPSGSVSVSGSAGNTTLTTPQIPSHTHTFNASLEGSGSSGGFNAAPPLNRNTGATGGGGSHSHPLTISSATFSGSAINLAVSYVDVIRATKN